MTSLLAPKYTLTIGSQQWTEQALSIEVRLEAAPLINGVSVRFPAAVPLDASPGDAVELTLDSGEQEELVFTGEVESVSRSFDEITVASLDGGAALARLRPAVTYEQITPGTLIRNMCGDAGVDVGSVEDGETLAFYSADPSRTALEHLARVCAWTGALGRVNNSNEFESSVINGATPEIALRFGRELISISTAKTRASIDSFVVAGESGAGATSAPDALRPSTDFFAGSRPSGPDSSNVWRFEPALRTAKAAGAAGASSLRNYKSSRGRGTFEAFLQPALRPGTVFEIQDLPDGLNGGPFWLTAVSHRLSRNGARTRARFHEGGSSFDPAALLGSLAAALF